MSKKDIILIGGGGHCKSCIDVIKATGLFTIAGILDVKERIGQTISGCKVIATDEEILSFVSETTEFFITAGQIKSAALRRKLVDKVIQAGGKMATVISPTAVVSDFAEIRSGSIVMHKCVINGGATIGMYSIINTGAIVEHDAIIGDYTHVSTMSCINGECRIGDECFIGSNAVINQGVTIGDRIIVGSGSVVNKTLEIPGTYAGNPARKIV